MEQGPGKSSMSGTKRNPSGKFVGSSQKTIIINLYKHMSNEYPNLKYKPMIKELSQQTGIGKTTIERTISEYKTTGVVTSPNRKRPRVKIFQKLSDEDVISIRKKIHDFWFRREIPNVAKIFEAVRDDPDLPSFSESSFYRILKRLEFKSMARWRNRALVEKDYIVAWRQQYIEDIQRYRSEGRPIYYLGETLLNAADLAEWGLTTGVLEPLGKGKRLIIGHVGSTDGFVPGALFCSKSKKDSDDSRRDMDGDTFFTWFRKILAVLKDGAVIVMDNAPHHSMKLEKYPNLGWKKNDIITWLVGKGEKVQSEYVKAQLLQVVEKYKRPDEKNYVIDEYAKQFGHTVVRLPPYHTELNPIEMAWSQIKAYIRACNTTNKLADVEKLIEDAVANVTAESWQNSIKHTTEEENKFRQLDNITDSVLDEGEPWLDDQSDNSGGSDSESG